jgi:hypothetical protein
MLQRPSGLHPTCIDLERSGTCSVPRAISVWLDFARRALLPSGRPGSPTGPDTGGGPVARVDGEHMRSHGRPIRGVIASHSGWSLRAGSALPPQRGVPCGNGDRACTTATGPYTGTP